MPPSEDHAEDIGALCSLDPLPAIDILLPSKEQFGPANAGAVSTVVHDLIMASRTLLAKSQLARTRTAGSQLAESQLARS